jgi:hypothetical protein
MIRLSNSRLLAITTTTAFVLASSHMVSAFVAPGGSYRYATGTSSRRNTLSSSSLHMAKLDASFQQKGGVTASSTSLQASSVADVETMTASVDITSTSAAKPSWNDDGFVFGLEGSGLERPKGRTASVVVEGDSLETTPFQTAVVSGTFLSHAIFCAVSVASMYHANLDNAALTAAQTVLLIASSWVAADFGSGILHWSVDNYGNGRTPVMGNIIAAFQGHHSAPWTITQRGFCNNVFTLWRRACGTRGGRGESGRDYLPRHLLCLGDWVARISQVVAPVAE